MISLHNRLKLTIALTCFTLSSIAMPGYADTKTAPKPLFDTIEMYTPGHFGNSFECMGEYEMRDLLREAKFWGCTQYCDWFDMLDCSDTMRPGQIGLSQAFWRMKKANFRSAQAAGLKNSLLITPNHVYVDQVSPDLRAEAGARVFGQLICPSEPKARKLILQNYEHLFADMKKGGIQLDKLVSLPYDYGGCRCEQCNPWIITWAKLSYEIYEIAQKYYPNVQTEMVGWWWEPEEHKLFAEWVDREHPGWVKAIYLHMPYGKTEVANVTLPKGCVKGAFVHISYGDTNTPRDQYGYYGPIAAPVRLEKTLYSLAKQGVTKVMSYSEGVCDNLNRAIFAGISSGQYKTSNEVITAYAKRHFGTNEEISQRWGLWIAGWGSPFDRDMNEANQELKWLLAKTPDPNKKEVQEWVLKAKLMEINQELCKDKGWTPERMELAEQFWQTREKIHRGLWGLGLQRHIFNQQCFPAPWYKSWATLKAEQVREVDSEQ